MSDNFDINVFLREIGVSGEEEDSGSSDTSESQLETLLIKIKSEARKWDLTNSPLNLASLKRDCEIYCEKWSQTQEKLARVLHGETQSAFSRRLSRTKTWQQLRNNTKLKWVTLHLFLYHQAHSPALDLLTI